MFPERGLYQREPHHGFLGKNALLAVQRSTSALSQIIRKIRKSIGWGEMRGNSGHGGSTLEQEHGHRPKPHPTTLKRHTQSLSPTIHLSAPLSPYKIYQYTRPSQLGVHPDASCLHKFHIHQLSPAGEEYNFLHAHLSYCFIHQQQQESRGKAIAGGTYNPPAQHIFSSHYYSCYCSFSC